VRWRRLSVCHSSPRCLRSKHLDIEAYPSQVRTTHADLVDRCVGPVKRALADAKISERDIDEVILVGGSTRVPAVQALGTAFDSGRNPIKR